MAEMTYLEAISDGLREEMRRDETVFCLGEDIGAFGGAFKVTDGFIEEFGADRVLDTPLAENAIIGTAVGAAVEGLRPVCEMQFADFISCGFDQLVNVAGEAALPPGRRGADGRPAALRRRLLRRAVPLPEPGGLVPAGARAEGGRAGDRRRRQGPADGAIRDPNPVCFLEHKGLYRYVKGEVPEGEHAVELGKARVAREGEEMTVIAYGSARRTSRSRRPRSSTRTSR